METSEVATDQQDSYCNYCSGRDAISHLLGPGDCSVPSQPKAAMAPPV